MSKHPAWETDMKVFVRTVCGMVYDETAGGRRRDCAGHALGRRAGRVALSRMQRGLCDDGHLIHAADVSRVASHADSNSLHGVRIQPGFSARAGCAFRI